MRASTCPDREELSSYLVGNLPATLREDVERHLEQCAPCQAQLVTLSDSDDTLVTSLRDEGTRPTYDDDSEFRRAVVNIEQFLQCDPSAWPTSQPGESDSPRHEDLSPRQVRDYVLLEKLGEGGMGAVYRAQHTRLKRTVAVKLLLAERVQNPQAVARFEREMEAAGAFDHPHIVRAYDAGEAEGIPFLVMEYVPGLDLARLVRRSGTLVVADACELTRQAALALQHAYEHGLVHRDVKPSNLMLSENGQVKLLDLGLARLRQSQQEDDRELTAAGQAVGTLDYMAPEQFDNSRDADIRADIYGLGATLYKLLTGQPPFYGPQYKTPIARMMALAKEETRPITEFRPDAPTALAEVVQRMLAKDPDDRFAAPGEVAAALAPFADGANLRRLVMGDAEPGETAALRGEPTSGEAPIGGSTSAAAPAALQSAVTQPIHRRKAPGRGNRARVAGGLALAAITLLAGLVIYVQTDRGLIEVKSFDENIAITVKRNGKAIDGVEVANLTDGYAYRTGRYEIEIKGGAPEGVEVRNGTFTLTRGGRQIVQIVRKTSDPAPAVEANAVAARTPAAIEKQPPLPKVIALIRNGQEVRSFATFAGLLADLEAEDVIELRGEGPFPVPHIKLDGKGLSIRAAPGFRPRLVNTDFVRAAAGQPWIEIQNASLRIEGCDLHCNTGENTALAGGGGPWEIRNCRILRYASNNGGLLDYQGPELTVVDSMIVNEFSHWSMGLGPGVVARFENNVIAFHSYLLMVLAPEGGQSIDLDRNTVSGPAMLSNHKVLEKPASVNAAGNVFRAEVLRPRGEMLDCFQWTGRGNFFTGPVLATLNYGDEEKQQSIQDLAAWRELWGGADEDSTWAPRLKTLQERLPTPSDDVAKSLPVDLLGGSESVGPDWSIVGPGDAYLRALAAAGSPVSEDELRPEVLEGGPFAVLREGEVAGSHPTLESAVDAAADGDVIQIRSDRPFSLYRPGRPAKSLTVIAAPGYLPICDSCVLAAEDRWTFEGLYFRGTVLAPGPKYGSEVEALRLINCTVANLDSAPGFGIADRDPEGGRPEIINCLIWARTGLILAPRCSARIENSVLRAVEIHATGGEGERRLELDRCHFRSPDLRAIENPNPDSTLMIDARRSVFDTRALLWTPLGTTHWTGDHNLFRLGGEPWMWAADQPIFSLAPWRRQWNSDANSTTGEPPILDPRQWQVETAEGQPIEAAGADIDRLEKALTPRDSG
jgi:hypothetical protein